MACFPRVCPGPQGIVLNWLTFKLCRVYEFIKPPLDGMIICAVLLCEENSVYHRKSGTIIVRPEHLFIDD